MAHLVVTRAPFRVTPGVEQLLLGARDDVEDVAFVVPEHATAGEDGALLWGAPDVDALRQAGEMGVALQAAQSEAVKRVDPQIAAGLEREVARDTAAHLLGGFLGEGQRHDAARIDAAVPQMAEAAHQGRGLAGTGTGQHELDGVIGAGGAALRGIEVDHAPPMP